MWIIYSSKWEFKQPKAAKVVAVGDENGSRAAKVAKAKVVADGDESG